MKTMSKKKTDTIWIYAFLLPTIVIFIIFYLWAIVTLLYTSFTKWDGANLPVFTGIKNYLKLFKADTFRISLVNLLKWSLLAGTAHVGFGVMIALLLYKKPHGWKFVRTVFMVPNVISAAAWAMIYKFVFNNDFGILNGIIRWFDPKFKVNWFYQSPYAFWAVTFTWVFYAVIVTLLVLGDLMAIPSDIEEAARIDGASGWYMTWKINLPLCRNSIGTGVILSITSRISMYESIALTTRGGPGNDTMNIPLIMVNAINDNNHGYANAASVIMLLLGILTMLLVYRVFRMNDSVY
ncbi:MAG: sugar ABC transporter permease [Clostridiales bacterium]|nr:sugar ABC transporter permease [Clostridiales bacterium]